MKEKRDGKAHSVFLNGSELPPTKQPKTKSKGHRQMATLSIKTAFTPALNKSGFSKLTFTGFEMKSGVSPVTNKETGEQKVDDEGNILTREWSFIKFNFELMGVARGTSQKVGITTNPVISEGSSFVTTLTNLGFEFPKSELVLDADGFEVESSDLEDDEFEQVDGDEPEELIETIETYLNDFVGTTVLAKVGKDAKNYWKVDETTIKVV